MSDFREFFKLLPILIILLCFCIRWGEESRVAARTSTRRPELPDPTKTIKLITGPSAKDKTALKWRTPPLNWRMPISSTWKTATSKRRREVRKHSVANSTATTTHENYTISTRRTHLIVLPTCMQVGCPSENLECDPESRICREIGDARENWDEAGNIGNITTMSPHRSRHGRITSTMRTNPRTRRIRPENTTTGLTTAKRTMRPKRKRPTTVRPVGVNTTSIKLTTPRWRRRTTRRSGQRKNATKTKKVQKIPMTKPQQSGWLPNCLTAGCPFENYECDTELHVCREIVDV